MASEDSTKLFTNYIRRRVFGLIANIADAEDDELFPMASGVIIWTEIGSVLVTVAHYLKDVEKWRVQKRLLGLRLICWDEAETVHWVDLDPDSAPNCLLGHSANRGWRRRQYASDGTRRFIADLQLRSSRSDY